MYDDTDLMNDIFFTAAKLSLKPKRQHSNMKRTRTKHQSWFNCNLQTLRKSVQAGSRQLAKDPYNPFLRSLYFRDLKHYNKLRKKTYRAYKSNLLTKLEQLEENDPKKFWTLLNALKSSNADKKTPPTSLVRIGTLILKN
jgi:hypothetical protein